jgi:hypothetical protein
MTEPYRSPALRDPPAVIDYRHLSPGWLFGVLAFFMALMLANSHRVTLHCERSFPPRVPGGSCESRDEGLVGEGKVAHFDLGKVRGALLDRGTKGATRVVLYPDRDNAEMTGRFESSGGDEKAHFVAAVSAFVADKDAGSLDVSYGSRWADNLSGLFVLLPVAGIIGLLSRRVRVIVDRASRQVRVQRSRFPLPAGEEGYELDQVTGAEIQESRGGKGGTVYRVALRLKEGGTVPLTSGYSSGRGAKEEAVDRIVAALRAARG